MVSPNLKANMIRALECRYSFSGGKKSYLQSASLRAFPTLETMLSIAAAQAVSLLDLIARPETSLAQEIVDGCDIQYLHFHPSPHTYRARSLSTLLARLTNMEDITYLPPLRVILSVLGMNRAQAMNLKRDECCHYESRRRRNNSPSMLGHLDRAFFSCMNDMDRNGTLRHRVRRLHEIALQLSFTESIPFERARSVVRSLREFRKASSQIVRARATNDGMKFRSIRQRNFPNLRDEPTKSEDFAPPEQKTIWELEEPP